MILTNEDYNGLTQVLNILNRIVKNAVMSELEEEHERNFERIKISEGKGILKFSDKELKKMPKEIKEILNRNLGRNIRQKANGVYEIRLTYKGNQYYGCSKDFNEAKRQFIESILNSQAPTEVKHKMKDCYVGDYAYHFLETFKKPTICDKAYRNYSNVVKNHICKNFVGVKVSEISATACQQIINKLKQAGKGRVCEDVLSLLNWICEAAVADGILKNNPMPNVKTLKHRRKNGKQIPVYIMAEYLSVPPCNRYDYCMWVMAYTGARPCELKSMVFEGSFVTIRNAKKRIDEEPTFRRIPVHQALVPYLEEIKKSITSNTTELGRQFHKRFSREFKLYYLRHTFTSRIQECGANKYWVDYATDHAAENMTDRVYTHWSDTFQVSEMEKLDYSESQNQSQN